MNPGTIEAVKDAAQTFTCNEKVLTITNPEFPLAIYADGYNVDEPANKVALSDELTASVEEHFEEVNQEVIEPIQDEREAMIGNLQAAISKIQFNTQNVIIPAIKAMATEFATKQNVSIQPDCSVTPFNYDAIHNDVRLTNHVDTRYARVRPLQEYRTFILNPVSASTIIEMVSINNPHLDQEQVTEWLLKMDAAKIESTWTSLFGKNRIIQATDLDFLSPQNFPFNVDELALAYFICGYYMENPQQVPGESVELEEWNVAIRLLHEMLGNYLLRAYQLRADYREQKVLVLRYDASRAIETRRVHVILNGDVAESWLSSNGDIQAVLGAAIEGTNIFKQDVIDAKAESLIKRWINIYPLIKQSALDYAERCKRNDIVDVFISNASKEPLSQKPVKDLKEIVDSLIRRMRPEVLGNPYKAFAQLICNVYYPESTYMQYLDTVEEYSQHYPDASLRELSTQAIISLVSIFLANQIKVESFSADVDPEATLPEVEQVNETVEESEPVEDVPVEETGEEVIEETDIEEDPYDSISDEETEIPLA